MRLRDAILSANTGLDAIKRAPVLDYPTDLRCIRIQDISQGKSYNEWAYTETSKENYKKFKLGKGDILIARTGATVGVSYYVNEDLESVYNNGTIRLKTNEDNNSKFIYYITTTKEFRQYIDNVSCVATQPNLRIENLLRFQCPDQPKETQDKIASVLSAYDDLIEKNNRKIQILQDMAEELYKEWFVRFRFPGHETAKFTDGIPDGWEVKKLNEIATVIMGQSPESQYYNINQEGLPFHQGVGSYGKLFLNDNVYSTKGDRIAEPNSIIFSVRAPVGRINRNLNKIILGRGVAAINSKDDCNAFLLYSLQNQFQMEDIIGSGTIFTSATRKDVESIKIIYPTNDILMSFNSVVQNIEDNLRMLHLGVCNLKRQRDLLLPRLMSGKLEVKVKQEV